MHCELAVPGLFGAAGTLRLPAAELLAARGRRTADEPASLEDWLADRFELADAAGGATEAPLAAGALTLLAHGGNPADASWARADPVHLRLMREHIALVPGEAFELSRREADELCATLNGHFSGRLEFQALEPLRWCVRAQGALEAAKRPALELAGADLRPSGAGDALANEIQMALHEHPVNEAREARGELAVNGLWLWGAGTAPRHAGAPWQSVSADEPLARGLARSAGIRHRPLPASADLLLERAPEDGRHLVVLDALRTPLALRDESVTASRAAQLEEKWFAPLLGALRTGRIGMLTLHVPDAGFTAETIRGDLRRFWRRAHSLARMST
jgi:hypothetical protein